MKKLFLICIILLVFSGPVLAGGQTSVVVPEKGWIEVSNPDGISNQNCHFPYGDSCVIEKDGILTIITSRGYSYLVEYSIDGVKYGSPCPNGTIFLISKSKYSLFQKIYLNIINEQIKLEQEKEWIRNAIKSPVLIDENNTCKYSVIEMDRLRRTIEDRYLFGSACPSECAGTSRSYRETEMNEIVEEQLRTYMLACIKADEIIKKDCKN